MGRKRKDSSDDDTAPADALEAKRPTKRARVMQQPKTVQVSSELDTGTRQVTITLDGRALADLDNLSGVAERKTGCIPSRSQIIRAALRAYWDSIK